jgi:hypothetical protein
MNDAAKRFRIGVDLKKHEFEKFEQMRLALGLKTTPMVKKMLFDPDFLPIDHARLFEALAVIAAEIASINIVIHTQLIPKTKAEAASMPEKMVKLIESYILMQDKLEMQIRELLIRIH